MKVLLREYPLPRIFMRCLLSEMLFLIPGVQKTNILLCETIFLTVLREKHPVNYQ
jgi:hypothetical protein